MALLSVASNTSLVIAKAVIGFLTGSVSVISEAIHSGVDLLASLIAYFAVRTSSRPADEDHPFGHGKVENISGAIEALLIFVAAGWIIYESVEKIIHPSPLGMLGWSVGVMCVSAVVNLFVSRRLFQVGKQTDSVALMADGWHLRTDVYTSAGVMFGLGLIWIGQHFFPAYDLRWLDPAIAIAVALLILHAAWRLSREAIHDLMDASIPAAEQEEIMNYFRDLRPEVLSFHRLRTRKSGPMRFIDLHIVVEPSMTVESSHGLTHQIIADLQKMFPSFTTVHVEPCDLSCKAECIENCKDSDRRASDPEKTLTR